LQIQPDQEERARRCDEQRALAERARQRFRQQLAHQQQQAINMAQPIDAIQAQALIDAAVNAVQQALQSQITQQTATIQQTQADLLQSQQDLAQAQNQITALQQAAAQQVLQPQQAQVAAIQFAYGPGTYGLPTDLIDYKITYKSNCEQLDSDIVLLLTRTSSGTSHNQPTG
jgi:chromosome segregation ATPase